jgi:transcription elongation factor GreA
MGTFTHSPLAPVGDHRLMTIHARQHADPAVNERVAANGRRETPKALMTVARLEMLRRDVEQLRQRTRAEVAQRLRDARAYGSGLNNDEYHALREEQLVLEARMARLQETVGNAVAIDPNEVSDGRAAIGSRITIEDLATGRQSRYRLRSAHEAFERDIISAASPMGQALMGVAPGAVVSVDLPNGDVRRVRLVAAETGAAGIAG